MASRATRIRNWRIPRAGQATALIAVLVLSWLLFIDRDGVTPVPDQPAGAVTTEVSVAEGPVAFGRAGENWQPAGAVSWRQIDADHAHFGFDREPLALRVRVDNPTDDVFRGVLVYKFPYIDRIRFLGTDVRGRPVSLLTGDSAPPDPRLPRSHFPAFPVNVAAGAVLDLYLTVETTSVRLTPVRLYSAEAFETANLRDQLLFAALFGAVIAVCMYVVTVYLTVRDKAFLDFIAFSMTYALYVAVASGMGQTWIWPGAWENANDLFFIVQGLLFASGARFFQRYMQTPERAPRVDIVMRVLIAVGLLTSLTPWLPSAVGQLAIAFVAGPGALFILGISIFLAVRGSDRARVVAFGWGFSQVTSVFIYLRIFDVTPYTPLNHYLTAIGCAIATLYFAIALALGLRRQQEQLLLAEKLNETRASFMAGMSHELRTPLNAIMGFSEMMREEMLGKIEPPVYRDYVVDIHDSSRNMLRLVDNILDISRVETGDFRLEPESVQLDELLEETAAAVAESAAEAKVTVRIDAAGPETEAVLDRQLMRRVLESLASNAVKFSPEEGEVVLSAAVAGGWVVFGIADNGPGMDPSEIERLLVPFEMVRVSAYKAKSGAGLGLPLAHALVRQHAGELAFETAPGAGTTVTVRLRQKT
ncbi:MAG: 7TM diverse intracellular signaling domain-containing protein [Minwuia sp.]|uniref:sensor histidine kinase n=1 Tax=Minwuia sp. TaxID=2493630 RepID=UPI003A8A8FE5